MTANQPSWPRQWLMTDERIGDRLWEAIDRLPPANGGIVFRHYSLGSDERLALGSGIAQAASDRKLIFAVAGSAQIAAQLGAALLHNPDESTSLPISLPVHDEAEAARARKLGAALAFVSPVYRTRSHASAPSLGAPRAAMVARELNCPAIALGGMDAARFDALEQAYPGLFHGYAGIDCWLSGQIRT